MNWFAIAERYHWTPQMVDELPAEFYEALPDMIAGLSAAQEEEQRRANVAAQAQAQSHHQRGFFPGSMAG